MAGKVGGAGDMPKIDNIAKQAGDATKAVNANNTTESMYRTQADKAGKDADRAQRGQQHQDTRADRRADRTQRGQQHQDTYNQRERLHSQDYHQRAQFHNDNMEFKRHQMRVQAGMNFANNLVKSAGTIMGGALDAAKQEAMFGARTG